MSDDPRIQSYRNLSRPKAVIYAVYLGVGALSLQASLNIANLVTNRSGALGPYPQFAAVLYLMLAGFFVLQAFLIYGIWLGRNLPRILYVGFALLGLVVTVANGGWAERLSVQPLTTGLFVLAMCLELTAAILLVLHASNAWFREVPTARASEQVRQSKKLRIVSSAPASRPVWLWTPGLVGCTAFFLGFPSGLALAALNWTRMGLRNKAITHLVATAAGALVFVILLLLLPEAAGGLIGSVLGLLLEVGMPFYLYNQTKKDTARLLADGRDVQDAHWFGGCLIGLVLGVVMTGLLFALAFVVALFLLLVGVVVPQ